MFLYFSISTVSLPISILRKIAWISFKAPTYEIIVYVQMKQVISTECKGRNDNGKLGIYNELETRKFGNTFDYENLPNSSNILKSITNGD